ncbi:rRNA maturation RNAse YbeY, partial [Lactococcus cremoris]|uniref:rRNA maturation RNAse YbeY n=1 Tax=Lactococcus lactis subsp. cremoris TaxID=1359 RepID=UPI001431172E
MTQLTFLNDWIHECHLGDHNTFTFRNGSIIGELFISIDKAAEQAADYGHSIEREYG